MKTKESGRNIHKILNAWLRNRRTILVFRRNKESKERDRKDNTMKAVKQFLVVFLSTIRDQAIL